MEISNLPSDLLEEILAKLPLTSPRKIRLTCMTWYTLFNTQSFAKKHINEAAKSESKLFIMLYSKVSLMCLNLQNIHNSHVEPSIKRLGKFNRSRGYDISQILHCDGLLLCIRSYNKGLVVWNPYLVQKRLIEPRTTGYHVFDIFALGYKEEHDKSRSYKILKYMYGYGYEPDGNKVTWAYEIYDLESSSWKLFDMTRPNWIIERDGQHGVSLKGNTFWVAQERKIGSSKMEYVVLCFDFTRERFGPSLSFPFQFCVEDYDKDYIALSSVREEKLVVSIQLKDWQQNTLEMEIWVTSEITQEKLLWSKLLAVDMSPFADNPFFFPDTGGSFLIDEEKKVAVFVSENHRAKSCIEATIIGVNGCLERVNIGKYRSDEYIWAPLMCSFVPSCVHIKQLVGGGQMETNDLEYYTNDGDVAEEGTRKSLSQCLSRLWCWPLTQLLLIELKPFLFLIFSGWNYIKWQLKHVNGFE